MKKGRHEEILNIIRDNQIENQEMLLKMLFERGYKVTQATISRDINELNIQKAISADGVNCYCQASDLSNAKFEGIFKQSVISVDYAMNVVCLKCHSGLANAACATFDVMRLDYVVGTIAGDDTVFILVRTEDDARQLVKKLNSML